MRCRIRWLFLLPLALAAGSPAQAGCNNLLCSCTASTILGVSFGTYDPTSSTDNTATGRLTVTCSLTLAAGGSYEVTLSTGQSGGYAQRTMSNGVASLNYNLYTGASAGSPVWGDGAGSTQRVAGSFTAGNLGNLLANVQSFSVYGRLPARQNSPAGIYTDTIIVTVIY